MRLSHELAGRLPGRHCRKAHIVLILCCLSHDVRWLAWNDPNRRNIRPADAALALFFEGNKARSAKASKIFLNSKKSKLRAAQLLTMITKAGGPR